MIHYKSAHALIPKLDQQIELESSGELTFELDNRPVTIPQEFTDAYRTIFPDIYKRTYLTLTDKSKAPEVLVAVFAEFLVHEGNFRKMEEHHILLLNDILERTCARINGQKPEYYMPANPSDKTVLDVRKIRLHEEILKSVEQELIKLAQVRAENICIMR